MPYTDDPFSALGLPRPHSSAHEPGGYSEALRAITEPLPSTDWSSPEEPWTRIHVELVRSGLWARLKPCSRSTYLVLCCLADKRKRVTISGVEGVARRRPGGLKGRAL